MNRPKTIVLISCVSQKGNAEAPAKDLYKGNLFEGSLRYARSLTSDENIYILSAEHHLVSLNQKIKPYDTTLAYISPKNRKPNLKVLTTTEKVQWGKIVIDQLGKIANLQNDKFIILAGENYIKPIKKAIKNIELPLDKLPIGKRLEFLNKKNN